MILYLDATSPDELKYEPQGEQIILFLCVSVTHILTQKPVHQLFSFISISDHKNLATIP